MTRPPSKAERRAFLREQGWHRIAACKSEAWVPRPDARTVWSLTAAYRAELEIIAAVEALIASAGDATGPTQ